MIVTILGSSAKQTAVRECVSILVDAGNDSILFDAGPGVVSSLRRVNRKSACVNKVILTHVHGDHILGFAYFIFDRNSEIKAQKDIPAEHATLTVYGQADVINLAKCMLDLAYPGMKLSFRLEFVEVANGSELYTDNTQVKFVDAVHAVPTLSTVLCCDGKKLVYTSDTLPNEALCEAAMNADCLIHEGMYTSASLSRSRKSKHATVYDAAQFANKAAAKSLLMVHIAPNMFGNEGEMLREAASAYTGNMSIPVDGCVYWV